MRRRAAAARPCNLTATTFPDVYPDTADASGAANGILVGARTVDRGHLRADLPEIHRELTAMVVPVVQHDRPQERPDAAAPSPPCRRRPSATCSRSRRSSIVRRISSAFATLRSRAGMSSAALVGARAGLNCGNWRGRLPRNLGDGARTRTPRAAPADRATSTYRAASSRGGRRARAPAHACVVCASCSSSCNKASIVDMTVLLLMNEWAGCLAHA